MDPETEKRAKMYYLGFFGLCACELAVNIFFIAKIQALFGSGPEELFMLAMFAYMVLSVGYAAGILWCLYQSKQIQAETGKTRWSIWPVVIHGPARFLPRNDSCSTGGVCRTGAPCLNFITLKSP